MQNLTLSVHSSPTLSDRLANNETLGKARTRLQKQSPKFLTVWKLSLARQKRIYHTILKLPVHIFESIDHLLSTHAMANIAAHSHRMYWTENLKLLFTAGRTDRISRPVEESGICISEGLLLLPTNASCKLFRQARPTIQQINCKES